MKKSCYIIRHRFVRKHKKKLFLLCVGMCLILRLLLTSSAEDNANSTELRRMIADENDMSVNTNSYIELFNEQNRTKKFESILTKRITKNGRFAAINQTSYKVLQYTTIFEEPRLCRTYDSLKERIYVDECPYKNCAFTCDKAEFNTADAILFHESDIKSELRKDPDFIQKSVRLHEQNPHMLFVLYNDEANPVIGQLDAIRFNWTMSYRRDAEVTDCSYGCFYARKQPKVWKSKIKYQSYRLFDRFIYFF